MDFDREVLQFSGSASRLPKGEAIAIFARWRERFPHLERTTFDGRFERGTKALQAIADKTPAEFYVFFEYVHQKIPTTYRCAVLRADALPLENRDLAIVDFQAGWTIVSYHEDGWLTDGPCYYEIAEPFDSANRR
jgi:hypothetical protein